MSWLRSSLDNVRKCIVDEKGSAHETEHSVRSRQPAAGAETSA